MQFPSLDLYQAIASTAVADPDEVLEEAEEESAGAAAAGVAEESEDDEDSDSGSDEDSDEDSEEEGAEESKGSDDDDDDDDDEDEDDEDEDDGAGEDDEFDGEGGSDGEEEEERPRKAQRASKADVTAADAGKGKGKEQGKGKGKEVVFGLRAANVNPVDPASLIPKPTQKKGPELFEHAPTHYLLKRLLVVRGGVQGGYTNARGVVVVHSVGLGNQYASSGSCCTRGGGGGGGEAVGACRDAPCVHTPSRACSLCQRPCVRVCAPCPVVVGSPRHAVFLAVPRASTTPFRAARRACPPLARCCSRW